MSKSAHVLGGLLCDGASSNCIQFDFFSCYANMTEIAMACCAVQIAAAREAECRVCGSGGQRVPTTARP
eukprot:2698747-Pleurochrysis_carterae.AAC.2